MTQPQIIQRVREIRDQVAQLELREQRVKAAIQNRREHLYLEMDIIRKACTHKQEDGSSAVMDGMFMATCTVCGEDW